VAATSWRRVGILIIDNAPGIFRPAPKALFFDFDGVILDSAVIKTEDFCHVYCTEAPEKIAEVRAYQELRGGISRRVKFEHFERNLFGRAVTETSLDQRCRARSKRIAHAMSQADFIPGAVEKLSSIHMKGSMHLISGMPENELITLLGARAIFGYFSSVAGSPKRKRVKFAKLLNDLGHRSRGAVAIGDSLAEFLAAQMDTDHRAPLETIRAESRAVAQSIVLYSSKPSVRSNSEVYK
jgi:phosphoglycolate phosphatase-like HAD superfamily hydrolase